MKKNIKNNFIFIGIIIIIIILIIIFIYYINKKRENIIVDDDIVKMCATATPMPVLSNGKLKAVHNIHKLWKGINERNKKRPIIVKFLEQPNGIMYTNLDFKIFPEGDYDPLHEEMKRTKDIPGCIQRIVRQRYEPITNLGFIFVNENYNKTDTDIRISFKLNKGCYSKVGTDALKERQIEHTMNFAWFDVSTVLHEFGHALGLEHEHLSPFEGSKINWNFGKLYDWGEKMGWDKAETDFQVVRPLDIADVDGTCFDPESIMLYFFPDDLTTDGKGTKQTLKLSPTDVYYINKLYPGSPETPENFYKRVYGKDIYPPEDESCIIS